MAAELGQTTDPKALVPGEPDAIDGKARELRVEGHKLSGIGDELKRVDVGSWKGEASEGFTTAFSKEPPKWLKSSDAVEDACRALIEYAHTLRWAQSQAAQAVELWEQGEVATGQATAAHQAAMERANANEAAGGPSSVLGASSDPGEKLRQEAREQLDRVRNQVDEVGMRTAGAVGGRPGAGQGALGALVDAVTSTWKTDGKAGVSGPGAGVAASGAGPKGQLGQIRAYAELAKASAEGSVSNDLFKLSGKAEAGVLAEATASASFSKDGVAGTAEAMLGAKASAETKAEAGPLAVGGKAEGMAGARAGASTTLGKGGLSAEADAFAGAKGSVEGSADVGGIGVTGNAEGWAGAGAEAGVDFGMNEDGEFEIGANAGLAPGLGGKLGFEVTVDPAKVTKTAGDAAGAVGDFVGLS